MKWFKKDRRALAKDSAAQSPAIATGSSDFGDTEERLEHESQQSPQLPEDGDLQRRPAPTAAPLAIPSTLGRYEVRRLLGTGGFGAVYLGHDGQLDRPVAIKVLHGGDGRRADPERARQEARRLAQLHHPGIVAVHDIGVHEGTVYIVSDYLEGTDLRSWMQDHRASWQDATRIVDRRARCARPCPRAACHPPRRQAREHHSHRRAHAGAGGLRPRAERGTGGRGARRGSSRGPLTTCRPNRPRARHTASTGAPTSIAWASCCTSC